MKPASTDLKVSSDSHRREPHGARPVAKLRGRRTCTQRVLHRRPRTCKCPSRWLFFFQLHTHGDEGEKSPQKYSDRRKYVGNCQRCGQRLLQEQAGMKQTPGMRVGLTPGSMTKNLPSLKSNSLSLLSWVSLQLGPHQTRTWSCVSGSSACTCVSL